MNGDVPTKPYERFDAMVQGASDYCIDAFAIDGMLVLGSEEGAIYVTKAQAMAFFDLVEKPKKTHEGEATSRQELAFKLYKAYAHSGSPSFYVEHWLRVADAARRATGSA